MQKEADEGEKIQGFMYKNKKNVVTSVCNLTGNSWAVAIVTKVLIKIYKPYQEST